MAEEIVYMLGVIAVGFAVNYTLRALPFIVFSGRDRALPRWVERLGGIISPVIIAGLIVYSYSTLKIGPEKASAWKTVWPYLAGAVTVALQLWRRNPLTSIVSGTILYMVLVNCCGCASQRRVYDLDASNPELRITADGVYFGRDKVDPEDILDTLEDAEIPKSRAIHIRLDRDMKDLRAPRMLMALLARGGYSRSLLVTEQHGESQDREVRLGADGFHVGSEIVPLTAIPARLDQLKFSRTRLLQILVDDTVRDATPAQTLKQRLKDAGYRYVEVVQMQREEDFMFTVTQTGVRYGLLTEVSPEQVADCLKNDRARHDSLIRLCGQESDFESEQVRAIMAELERILKASGYVNVKRFWLKAAKRPEGRSPTTEARPRRPATRTVNGIRYKSANE